MTDPAMIDLAARDPQAQTRAGERALAIMRAVNIEQAYTTADIARALGASARECALVRLFAELPGDRFYLSPLMIKLCLRNGTSASVVPSFYNDVLRAKWTLGTDYFVLDPHDRTDRDMIDRTNIAVATCFHKTPGAVEAFKHVGQRVFYAITRDCFGEIAMRAKGERGREMCTYYQYMEMISCVIGPLTHLANIVVDAGHQRRLATMQDRVAMEIEQARTRLRV